jgi:hypothetical protein
MVPILWSRQVAISRRTYFFEALLNICRTGVDGASEQMGQVSFYVPADRETAIVMPADGVLIFHIDANFYGMNCKHTYSLWQFGRTLKVGLLLDNGLDQAPLVDFHNEIRELWNAKPYLQYDRDGITLYEWTFDVPQLYTSWLEQESFILGMRHCQLRVLRIIHDFAKMSQDELASSGHFIEN